MIFQKSKIYVSEIFGNREDEKRKIILNCNNVLDYDRNNRGIIKAAEIGYKDLVKYFMLRGANMFNTAAGKASANGHKDIFIFLNKKCNKPGHGLYNAAIKGQKELIFGKAENWIIKLSIENTTFLNIKEYMKSVL